MSLLSWKDEYYPVRADALADASMVEAVEHSLRKWEGLKRTNLKRHEVVLVDAHLSSKHLVGGARLAINAESCALCVKYGMGSAPCEECPLYIVRGNVACAEPRPDEYVPPYQALSWKKPATTQPMLMWLRKALKYAKEQEA